MSPAPRSVPRLHLHHSGSPSAPASIGHEDVNSPFQYAQLCPPPVTTPSPYGRWEACRRPRWAGDGDDGGLAACGIGPIEQRLAGPHLRNGRIGHVLGVITDPARRRRGHSRAIMRGMPDWFREREVDRVDLYAFTKGEPLDRDLGFTDLPDPALCRRP